MSSIGSVSSSSSTLMQSMQGMRKRPDPEQMAENLFSKLDTSSQGYIEKSDLQAAFDTISSDSTSSATSVDELFSQLDTDSDGKVTQQEFSDTLRQVAEQFDNQFASMRMQGGGGMPPPPPSGEGDEGFTQEELSSQLEEIGSTDTERSSLISNIVSNFDEADSDGNGKVSFQEAMAYDQAGTSTATSTDGSSTSSASSTSETSTNKLMAQIMRLMQAYSVGADSGSVATSSISVTA